MEEGQGHAGRCHDELRRRKEGRKEGREEGRERGKRRTLGSCFSPISGLRTSGTCEEFVVSSWVFMTRSSDNGGVNRSSDCFVASGSLCVGFVADRSAT